MIDIACLMDMGYTDKYNKVGWGEQKRQVPC